MRVDEPFGNEAKAGLNMFRIIEPQTWAKVVNRVSGANFGNIYGGSKIMNANFKLPKNHTWKSFTKFLLNTLPKETADNYRSKFIKFIKY
jgi:predicted phosphoadenosine phosphosulfate sulfurtransferase